jgi:hypothetical protein
MNVLNLERYRYGEKLGSGIKDVVINNERIFKCKYMPLFYNTLDFDDILNTKLKNYEKKNKKQKTEKGIRLNESTYKLLFSNSDQDFSVYRKYLLQYFSDCEIQNHFQFYPFNIFPIDIINLIIFHIIDKSYKKQYFFIQLTNMAKVSKEWYKTFAIVLEFFKLFYYSRKIDKIYYIILSENSLVKPFKKNVVNLKCKLDLVNLSNLPNLSNNNNVIKIPIQNLYQKELELNIIIVKEELETFEINLSNIFIDKLKFELTNDSIRENIICLKFNDNVKYIKLGIDKNILSLIKFPKRIEKIKFNRLNINHLIDISNNYKYLKEVNFEFQYKIGKEFMKILNNNYDNNIKILKLSISNRKHNSNEDCISSMQKIFSIFEKCMPNIEHLTIINEHISTIYLLDEKTGTEYNYNNPNEVFDEILFDSKYTLKDILIQYFDIRNHINYKNLKVCTKYPEIRWKKLTRLITDYLPSNYEDLLKSKTCIKHSNTDDDEYIFGKILIKNNYFSAKECFELILMNEINYGDNYEFIEQNKNEIYYRNKSKMNFIENDKNAKRMINNYLKYELLLSIHLKDELNEYYELIKLFLSNDCKKYFGLLEFSNIIKFLTKSKNYDIINYPINDFDNNIFYLVSNAISELKLNNINETNETNNKIQYDFKIITRIDNFKNKYKIIDLLKQKNRMELTTDIININNIEYIYNDYYKWFLEESFIYKWINIYILNKLSNINEINIENQLINEFSFSIINFKYRKSQIINEYVKEIIGKIDCENCFCNLDHSKYNYNFLKNTKIESFKTIFGIKLIIYSNIVILIMDFLSKESNIEKSYLDILPIFWIYSSFIFFSLFDNQFLFELIRCFRDKSIILNLLRHSFILDNPFILSKLKFKILNNHQYNINDLNIYQKFLSEHYKILSLTSKKIPNTYHLFKSQYYTFTENYKKFINDLITIINKSF